MTLLGKIFTLLLMLLSLLFFFLSVVVNATHRDDKSKIAEFQNRAKTLETTVDELKKSVDSKKNELDQERVARRTALAALQTQLEAIKGQLAEANSELQQLNSVNTMQTQKLSDAMDTVKRLTSENDLVKQEMDKVIDDRNLQRRNVISLTDRLNNLMSIETDLRASIKQLQDQSTVYQAQAETMKATLASAGITDPEDVPPADLKGLVLAVGSDQEIEISVGRDDGLREGHTLEVFRGSSYLGRIEIRRVVDDKAIGKVVPGFRKGYIQAGDKVVSKLR